MDEVQGADGVVWTWGAPAGVRGDGGRRTPAAGSVAGVGGDPGDTGYALDVRQGYVPTLTTPPTPAFEEPVTVSVTGPGADSGDGSGAGPSADAEAEAARAEEEWLAAGLTVRRPSPPPQDEVMPTPGVPEVPAVDAPRDDSPDPPGPPEDEVTRAEEEWEAAGLTVRRSSVRVDPPIDPSPLEVPPQDAPHEGSPHNAPHEEPVALTDPGLVPTPQDERDDGYEGRHHAAEERARAAEEAREHAGSASATASGSGLGADSEPVDEMVSEGAPAASPVPVADAGPVPETGEQQPTGSAAQPDQVATWNGAQGGPEWQQQAQPTPGQWPGQEPWQHEGGHHAEPAEQAWHHEPAGARAAAAPAAQQPTGQVWDPRQQRWVQPEPAIPAAAGAPAPAAAAGVATEGVDPAYTWRGERGELYVWDGYQWVLQPETTTANLPVPAQASAQPQPVAEHTWDGPNGEYWVWDGYQWVQRERPAPAVAGAATGPAGPAGGGQVATPQPAEVTSPDYTWDGPDGEYWVWEGSTWVQQERPTVRAAADPVQTWTGDDGQVWEWDAVGSQWHQQQGRQGQQGEPRRG